VRAFAIIEETLIVEAVRAFAFIEDTLIVEAVRAFAFIEDTLIVEAVRVLVKNRLTPVRVLVTIEDAYKVVNELGGGVTVRPTYGKTRRLAIE
jgi:hypothetical protein